LAGEALKEEPFRAVSVMDDRDLMKRVLRLARKGTGKVSPNPRVGALLVKEGRILSESYHARFGGPHAEVNVLSKLSPAQRREGTLYINLEPCNHHGKTPPCTDMIIESGVRRVVVGITDPNPRVNGKGIRRLREAGIDVHVGVLEQACSRMNEAYIKYITQKKPFITLKVAQTLDGKITTNSIDSRWITCQSARKFAHRIRNEHDAILVGVNTVITDDPQLTVRWGHPRTIRRIILDSQLRIPLKSRVLNDESPEKTYVVTTFKASSHKKETIERKGANVWVLDRDASGRVDLSALWKKMGEEHITSVLVEGGSEVFTAVLKTGDVDRVVAFIAPKLFGKGLNAFDKLDRDIPDDAFTFREYSWNRKGSDIVFDGRM
jgi:diaminohydroxyphosphoribosylaminopyrimidine deaminase/5-amino-6-(5-phosphoribosylamino)uracil reductase